MGLSTAAEAARLGFELLDRGGVQEQGFERYRAPADPSSGGNGGPPEAPDDYLDYEPPPPPTVDAPPPVPDGLVPDHVDEEVVLVAEVAEEGAEDGAGAELRVDAPWEGYDQMTAADIRHRLGAASPVEAAAVQLYETTNKSRKSVLEAAERALRSR